MTHAEKMEMLGALVKGGCNIGNLIMEVHGDLNNYYDEKGNKHSDASKSVKDTIIDYVMRLEPVVANNYKPMYKEMWTRIIELEEVRSIIYDRGRQQGTSFNRNFVANIVHVMSLESVFLSDVNDVRLTELLEPSKGKDHPVRSSLAYSPDGKVKRAIEGVFLDLGVKV